MNHQHISTHCAMCEHPYARDELTKHHLVPKSRGGTITVLLCRPCHSQIHAVYTEKELEREFGTLEELLAAPRLQGWVEWIRKRKPTSRVPTRRSKQKGR